MAEMLQSHLVKGFVDDITDSRSLRKTIKFSYHQVVLKASAANCSFFLRTPTQYWT